MTELQEAADWDGVAALPEDFADKLFDLAWDHRSDLEGPVFKKAVKDYIKSIFPDEGVQ